MQRVALKGPSDEYESENVGVMLCDTVKDFDEVKKLIDAVPLGVGFIEKNRLLNSANQNRSEAQGSITGGKQSEDNSFAPICGSPSKTS